ncbi:hypothetical protein DESC_830107 [Desulfosarcina cetonica]|nr:hypothetical protein DESC_830107 [Desulfosarcina cetonica]
MTVSFRWDVKSGLCFCRGFFTLHQKTMPVKLISLPAHVSAVFFFSPFDTGFEPGI